MSDRTVLVWEKGRGVEPELLKKDYNICKNYFFLNTAKKAS